MSKFEEIKRVLSLAEFIGDVEGPFTSSDPTRIEFAGFTVFQNSLPGQDEVKEIVADFNKALAQVRREWAAKLAAKARKLLEEKSSKVAR